MALGLIAALFVIESALNAVFISRGDELGLLGGFGQAVAIAFLNIGFALFIGIKVAPWLWHVAAGWKLLGGVLIAAHAASALVFNLLVAHYRDALAGAEPEAAARAALAHFAMNPFTVADFQSWMMVALGCFFALLALIDGWATDDPYPGYGALDKRRRRSEQEYADLKADLIDELRLTRDQASAALLNLKTDLTKRRSEHDSIHSYRRRLIASFYGHLSYLERCANELLSFYRTANMRARSSPAPAHFDQPFALARPIEPEAAPNALTSERLEAAFRATYTALDQAITKVHAEFETAVAAYRQIDELTSTEKQCHALAAAA